MQIRVNSSRMIRVTQVDSEEELEEFNVWNVFSFLKEKLNDTSIDVDLYSKKTCLKVELLETGTTYCVVLFRRMSPPWRGLLGGRRVWLRRRFQGGNEDVARRAHGLRASRASHSLGRKMGLQREACLCPWDIKWGNLGHVLEVRLGRCPFPVLVTA